MVNNITLTIKKQWFDMIKAGNKKEEYREIKPFYTTRIDKLSKEIPLTLILINGYCSKSPRIKVNVKDIKISEGKPEWGAEQNKKYYVFCLGAVI